MNIDKYIKLFGEQHRSLINNCLQWIKKQEDKLGIGLDRDKLIMDVIKGTAISKEKKKKT